MTVSPLGWVVVWSLVGVVAIGAIASGWVQERPSLQRTLARLGRDAPQPVGRIDGRPEAAGSLVALGRAVLRLGDPSAVLPSAVTLRLAGRTRELHVATLLLAALIGAVGPLVVLAALQLAGLLPLGVTLPVGVALAGAAAGPLLVHVRVTEVAEEVRSDLRHQLSAYLDVVTMLLAGNTGHEGALEQAAGAGDGRLFHELRRRMREAAASGRSLVDALDVTGRELGLVELQQVAATTALSAAEGAPVARTLAAKCATLRSTLASEQETEARLRTSRLTPPLVGMSLIFMALVVYPALSIGGSP